MKKILLFVLPLLVLAQNRYLVSFDLDTQRLEPLFSAGIDIVGEFENYAICVVDDNDLTKMDAFNFTVIDRDPFPDQYYLVKIIDPQVDLSAYGIVLIRDGEDVLLRLFSSSPEEIMHEGVMLKRVTFKPLVPSIMKSYPGVNADPTIEEIVALINPDSILATVQRLQDFVTRYSTHDSCDAAAVYLANRLNQYGCDSVFMQYHTGGHAPNVIGVKRGNVYPESIYTVICGHFDTYSYLGPDIAPGADDNASGTASVIEACRVMRDYEFEYSVRYIAFSGEEFGLFGSAYYAAYARTANDSILGVFNSDMIAYVDALPESIEVMASQSNPPCGPLVDFFIACADTYATLLTHKRLTNSWIPSDNQSFNDNGYVALLNIDDYYPTNPWYHYPGDTIGSGFNNLPFCNEVTRAQTAALATMAVPYNTAISETKSDVPVPRVLTIQPSIGNKRFQFALDKKTDNARVTIYNSAGIRLNSFRAGFPYVWDGTDRNQNKLSSGIYFVKVEAAGTTLGGKLIISK